MKRPVVIPVHFLEKLVKHSGLWLLPILLAGCATVPRPLQGEFAAMRPLDASSANGTQVRWGGSIIAVEPRTGETCFEVLGRALNERARPRETDTSDGRFLACRNGFYDPEVFKAGRDITVTGALAGDEIRKVGEFDYRYPRVNAQAVYLWPERSDRDIYHHRPFFLGSPFWYGYNYPVIIHRSHRRH